MGGGVEWFLYFLYSFHGLVVSVGAGVLVDLLRICLHLSNTEVRVFLMLLRGGRYTVDDVAAALGIAVTTASRALNSLYEAGIVERERVPRENPGRPRFRYYIPDPGSAVERVAERLATCVEEAEEELRRIRAGR